MKDFQRLIKKTKKLPNKIVKRKGLIFHAILPVYSIILLLVLFFDINLKKYNSANSINPSPIPAAQVYDYPILSEGTRPNLSAKAAIVMDNDSKVVVFAKNPKLLFSMASTTKIMTALVAMDFYDENDALTVKTEEVAGVTIGLKKGQRILFKDLLHAMLLPSSNDAAVALAQNYPGGETAFVNKMNEFANNFRLFNTSFADAAGLLDELDHTTPVELARLASIALKNKLFAEIVSTKHKVISDVDGLFSYSIFNLNKLLGIDGINGVKTGFTDEAGQVLVTSKNKDGHTLIAVVMKSEDRFGDTKKLLDYVSDNLSYQPIRPELQTHRQKSHYLLQK